MSDSGWFFHVSAAICPSFHNLVLSHWLAFDLSLEIADSARVFVS